MCVWCVCVCVHRGKFRGICAAEGEHQQFYRWWWQDLLLLHWEKPGADCLPEPDQGVQGRQSVQGQKDQLTQTLLSIIALMLSLGLKRLYKCLQGHRKKGLKQERVKVTNHSKWKMVGLLNGFCQLHRMNVNGFQRTFLFLNELPRSSRCNINAKSASSWSSLITVSSLTEVLSLCHCCQAKYKSTNLHLQWQTLPLTLLPYPHLQLRLLLLFFLYFPSHLISLAVSIPSLDSMPSNHS